jgi:hypothetical protein
MFRFFKSRKEIFDSLRPLKRIRVFGNESFPDNRSVTISVYRVYNGDYNRIVEIRNISYIGQMICHFDQPM